MAITLVQSATNTGTSLTSLTVTLGSATTPGNTLIVCLSCNAATTNPTPTAMTIGGSADNFTLLMSGYSFPGVNIWGDSDLQTSSTSVVITMGGGAGTAWTSAYVYEVSGLSTSPVIITSVDQGVMNNGDLNTAGTTWSSGTTGITAQAAEFWVGMVTTYYTSAEAITGPAGSWTNLAQHSATSPYDMQTLSGWQITSSTGNAVYSGTTVDATMWCAAVITFASVPVNSTPMRQLSIFSATATGSLTANGQFIQFPATGNLVVALVSAYAYTGTAATISTVLLGTAPMTAAAVSTPVTTNPTAGIYYLPVSAPASQYEVAVTCTGATAADMAIVIIMYEFDTGGAAWLADKTAQATATSAAWSSGVTATTTQASELVVGLYSGKGAAATTQTGAAGWTNTQTNNTVLSPNYNYVIGGVLYAPSAGQFTYAGTSSASEEYAALIATLGTVAPPALPPSSRGVSTWRR